MSVQVRRFSFIFFWLIFITSCEKKESLQKDTYIQPTEVEVVKIQKDDYVENLNSFGTISYNFKNNITCLQSGQIYYFPHKEGDYIKKGQIIAKLKNIQLDFQKDQYINTLTSAKASLEITKNQLREQELSVESALILLEKAKLNIEQKELELELQRENLKTKEELYAIGGVTESALKQIKISVKSLETDIAILKKELEISMLGYRDQDLLNAGYIIPIDLNEKKKLIIELNTLSIVTQIKAAEAEVKNAETALSSINKLIDELVITSPLSGVLGSKSYELGEFVKENESIATIMDISNVYGVINIQEKDIVNYSVGSNIEIEIPSLSRKINTKISEISPYADPQSGNFSVKAKIENKDNIIKPGMFIKCNLKQANTTTLYKLPESTLISKSNDVGLVFYVNNGFVIQQSINIKHLKDGFVWFDSELNENDYIINNPSPFLREGQSVSTK